MIKVTVGAILVNLPTHSRLISVIRDIVVPALPRKGDEIIFWNAEGTNEHRGAVDDVVFDTKDGTVSVSLGQYLYPEEVESLEDWTRFGFVEEVV